MWWPLVALVAVGSQIYEGAIFDYNSTATLAYEKILLFYKSANSTSVVKLETAPSNGFYKLDIDQFKDELISNTFYGRTTLRFKDGWSPFLRYTPSSEFKTIVAGTIEETVSGAYFYGGPVTKQGLVLPPPATDSYDGLFQKTYQIPLVSNAIITLFDASPAYVSNLSPDKQNCPPRPTTMTACTEISPDDIYGAGNAFSGVYFYSKNNQVAIPTFNTAIGLLYTFIAPPESVFCYSGTNKNDNFGVDAAILKEATDRGICSSGYGYDSNVKPCDVFGKGGVLAYGNGVRQLDAYMIPPKIPNSLSGSNPTPDTKLECLPWSVIQEQNVEYVLDDIGFRTEDQNEALKEELLNKAKEADRGCQNFKIGGAISLSMYCPVMYRPWLYLTLQFVIPPDEVFTYTNTSNGQTYYFWVGKCYNDAKPVIDQAIDIMFDKLNETCVPCPIGGYSNADTEYICTSAPEGTYAKADHTGVVPCNASLFQYSNSTGNSECRICNGTSNVTGASYQVHNNSKGWGVSCTSAYCLRGQFFNPATELCENCTTGTYTTDNISRGCLRCSGVGSHLVVESGYSVGCRCEPGHGKAVNETVQCQICSSGEYNDKYENSDLPCKSCFDSPTRSIANDNHTKCVCQKGSSGQSGNGTNCNECAAGRYTNTTNELTCISCTAGTFQNEGAQTSCLLCSPGSYTNTSGQIQCTDCSVGTATDPNALGSLAFLLTTDSGKTECLACNGGTYQDRGGQDTCLACTAGTYASSEGESLCKACTQGTYQNQTKATTNCIECHAGDYQQDQGQTVCEKCQGGSYSADKGASSCTVCSPGAYQDQSEQSDCKECTGGTYQGQRGQSSCRTCIVGTYSGAKATICTECERGKYQDNPGNSQCKECAAGTYTDQTKSTDCIGCTPGKFQEEAGQTKCESCPEGTYTYSGDVSLGSCSPCPIGTYGNEEGATTCKACFLGAYSYNEGSISCSVNKVNQRSVTASQGSPATFCRNNNNTHAPYNGLTTCLKCYPGTFHPYSVGGDAKVCELCPAGTYQDEFGSPDCKLCPSNQRGLKEGQYQCACAPGSYDVAKIDYPPQCQRCGGQEYQDEVGSREGCKTCEDFYMPLPGHQGCVPIYEEVTDTCLMVFWRRECYSKGVHPITIALWLVVLVLVYQIGKAIFKETRHAILDSK